MADVLQPQAPPNHYLQNLFSSATAYSAVALDNVSSRSSYLKWVVEKGKAVEHVAEDRVKSFVQTHPYVGELGCKLVDRVDYSIDASVTKLQPVVEKSLQMTRDSYQTAWEFEQRTVAYASNGVNERVLAPSKQLLDSAKNKVIEPSREYVNTVRQSIDVFVVESSRQAVNNVKQSIDSRVVQPSLQGVAAGKAVVQNGQRRVEAGIQRANEIAELSSTYAEQALDFSFDMVTVPERRAQVFHDVVSKADQAVDYVLPEETTDTPTDEATVSNVVGKVKNRLRKRTADLSNKSLTVGCNRVRRFVPSELMSYASKLSVRDQIIANLREGLLRAKSVQNYAQGCAKGAVSTTVGALREPRVTARRAVGTIPATISYVDHSLSRYALWTAWRQRVLSLSHVSRKYSELALSAVPACVVNGRVSSVTLPTPAAEEFQAPSDEDKAVSQDQDMPAEQPLDSSAENAADPVDQDEPVSPSDSFADADSTATDKPKTSGKGKRNKKNRQ